MILSPPPSDGFTDTSGLSVEGITGRVLLILSAVIQLLVWTVTFAAVAHVLLGLYAFIACNLGGTCAEK